jgi:ribosomal protein S18 acetylase RimI-like enzyme
MGAPLIRAATEADVPQVRRVLVETWHATYDASLGVERVTAITDAWHSIENLTRQVHAAGEMFLVAEFAGEVVGTASLQTKPDGSVRLARLYVLPRAQRNGIGQALLAEGLRRLGAPAVVTLEVEPGNAAAIRFYEAAGFVVEGRTGECGGPGAHSDIPALIMVRRRAPA